MNTILAAGRADLVALARPHLADPYFALRAAAEYGTMLPGPVQYAPGREQLLRTAATVGGGDDGTAAQGAPAPAHPADAARGGVAHGINCPPFTSITCPVM